MEGRYMVGAMPWFKCLEGFPFTVKPELNPAGVSWVAPYTARLGERWVGLSVPTPLRSAHPLALVLYVHMPKFLDRKGWRS